MMRKSCLIVALLLLASPARAPAQPAATSVSVADRIDQFGPTLDAHFERFREESHVPGLAFGVVAEGRLAYIQTLGTRTLDPDDIVRPDTLFRIASMSKAFTALAILKLRDEGQLRLDDLAEQHVPELRGWRYPTGDSPRIRVRDLLSHTGGFVTDDPWGDRQQVLSEEDFTRMLREGVPFTRAPQTAFEYSNFGYALLGRIITNASGRPYADYIEQEIMRPLGMQSTRYDIFASPEDRRAIGYRWENGAWAREPDMRHGTFGAMGGVQTSAEDYARWVAFLLSAWPARDGPETGPLRRSTVRELAQGLNFVAIARRPGDPESCPQAQAYGMGFRVAQDCELGLTLAHGGGYPGYGSYLLLLPEQGVGLFALSNRTYAGPSPPVWRAALDLHRAGLIPAQARPVSDALALMYHHAGNIYLRGNLEGARERLAMNFLMDRSEENWARALSELRAQTGECRTDSPIRATGILSGTFTWTCERANLDGQLLLAPTRPATIQALRFIVVPR
jgi:serine-type D-Ala-D-Ala carboxypeptidase/endopeptidase